MKTGCVPSCVSYMTCAPGFRSSFFSSAPGPGLHTRYSSSKGSSVGKRKRRTRGGFAVKQVEELARLLFVRDEPERADLALVFGHHDPDTSARRVRHAARLYTERFVPRLLVTGGVTAPGGPAEAELMAAVAVDAG